MNNRYNSGYDPSQIRLVPFPKAKVYGDGWWCSAWEVETVPRELPKGLRLPPPPWEIGGAPLIVAILAREPGQITVEVLSRHEKLFGEEVAYISLIMQAIHALYPEITIEGYSDHPVLRMAGASHISRAR